MQDHLKSVGKNTLKKDSNWVILAEDARREIKRLQKQVYKLRKSFNFFNKQYESGVEFPAKKLSRHSDSSSPNIAP
jgi:mRNA-degrading endonuclease RelE of RelBE toxin-antitoxin system